MTEMILAWIATLAFAMAGYPCGVGSRIERASLYARLGKAVAAYNRLVTALESRVTVSACRLRDLKAGAADDVEISEPQQIEKGAAEGCRRRKSHRRLASG